MNKKFILSNFQKRVGNRRKLVVYISRQSNRNETINLFLLLLSHILSFMNSDNLLQLKTGQRQVLYFLFFCAKENFSASLDLLPFVDITIRPAAMFVKSYLLQVDQHKEGRLIEINEDYI
jgi:hypothetical protein